MTELQQAMFEQKHLIRKMLELYAYDLSEYDDSDLNEGGEFGHSFLDQYWTEKGRVPFIVRVDGHPAGFVLINNSHERERTIKSFAASNPGGSSSGMFSR